MVFINKDFANTKEKEPPKFTLWKVGERQTLEQYYRINDSANAWAHLRNPPQEPVGENIIYTKSELRSSLYKEQKAICAYCMNRIVQDYTCTIDHLVAKENDARQFTFNYQNLLACCSGRAINSNEFENVILNTDKNGRKTKEDARHCNNKKGSQEILINPFERHCNKYFYYDRMGKIYGNKPKSKDAINKLGLNSKVLVLKRKFEISKFLYPYASDRLKIISISDTLVNIIYLKLGKFQERKIPFCDAIEKILIDELLIRVKLKRTSHPEYSEY